MLNAWRSDKLVVRLDIALKWSGLALLGVTLVIVISKPGGVGNVADNVADNVIGNFNSSPSEYT